MTTIYEKIKSDHDKVRGLIKQILELDEDQGEKRAELFDDLKTEITAHSIAEEDTLYNRIQDEDRDQIEHSMEEHEEVQELLEKISRLNVKDKQWMKEFKKLKKSLEEHIEEEESEVFDIAQETIDSSEAEALGEEMDELEEVQKSDSMF